MQTLRGSDAELELAWVEREPRARWRSAAGPAGAASGSSLLEVPAGCRLPRHTDSAEEVVVVLAGEAELQVGDETARLGAGDVAVVPECVPHDVRNVGADVLRFLAVYASSDVVTTYEQPVQPDGSTERRPVG